MKRRIVVLGLLVAACSGGTAETTTTAMAPPTTAAPVSTTSTTEAVTTSTVPEVTVLGPGRLIPGQVYVYSFDLLDMEIEVAEPGWLVNAARGRLVDLESDSVGRPVEVTVTLMPFDTADDIIADLAGHRHVSEVTDPVPVTVGGWGGVTFQVVVPSPSTTPGIVDPGEECSSPILVEEGSLGEVVRASQLVGCAVNRVWIVDVAGTTVVVHAGDASGKLRGDFTAEFDGLEPLIAELLAAITFKP